MTLLFDALRLMIIGMGTVFLFIFIMLLWMKLSAKISARFEHLLPETAAPSPQRSAAAPSAGSALPDNLLPAVIAAAIHQYRRDRA